MQCECDASECGDENERGWEQCAWCCEHSWGKHEECEFECGECGECELESGGCGECEECEFEWRECEREWRECGECEDECESCEWLGWCEHGECESECGQIEKGQFERRKMWWLCEGWPREGLQQKEKKKWSG